MRTRTYHSCVHEISASPRLTFGHEAFDEIFRFLDLKTDAEKASFLSIAESSFNRTRRGVTLPGGQFIAYALYAINSDPRLAELPADRKRFDRLFPIAMDLVG
jgi:hypothetical protein